VGGEGEGESETVEHPFLVKEQKLGGENGHQNYGNGTWPVAEESGKRDSTSFERIELLRRWVRCWSGANLTGFMLIALEQTVDLQWTLLLAICTSSSVFGAAKQNTVMLSFLLNFE
jgi:hypothetical protein